MRKVPAIQYEAQYGRACACTDSQGRHLSASPTGLLLKLDRAFGLAERVNRRIGMLRLSSNYTPQRCAILIERAARLRRIVFALAEQAMIGAGK